MVYHDLVLDGMESEAAEQSMNIADAGYSLAKESLRGADLTALLAAATTVDRDLPRADGSNRTRLFLSQSDVDSGGYQR